MSPLSHLPTGQYRLVNVKYGSMVHLQDATGRLSARKGSFDGTVQWAVTNISDKKYTLQNVAHSAYAWVTHWSREDDDLKGKSSAHRFYISQAGSADRYVIFTTDSDLCWGLDSGEEDTPLSLCDDSSDPRSMWKFELAQTQATEIQAAGGGGASSVAHHSTYDLRGGINSGMTGKLKSGRYILTNVRSRNIAALQDPNDGSSLLASVQDDSKAGLWDLTLHSNGRFEIKNVGHDMCAWVESRASEMTDIQGRAPARLSRLYEIRETGAEGRYVISTTDSKLLWGIDDDECGTSISLRSAIATDSRNQWKLIPYREGGVIDHSRQEETIRAGEEAIEKCRQRAAGDPCNLAALALSLHDQATSLGGLGHEEDAVRVAEEAVEIQQRLAAKDLSVLPDLADSLHNLAGYLHSLDHEDSAVRRIGEAVEIRRRLAASNKELLPDLAQSLDDQADYLYNTDCNSSVTAIKEAISIRQGLVRDDPELLSDLADSFDSLTGYLEELHQPRDAAQTAHEALDILRQLAVDDETRLPELAASLDDQAGSLSELGDYADSARCLEEAIKIRRRLAASLLQDLGDSLQHHAECLHKMGSAQDAVTAVGEAVKVRRRLVDDDSDDLTVQSDLASSLHAYAEYTAELGNQQKAATIIGEAIQILRTVATDDTSTSSEDGSSTSSKATDDRSSTSNELDDCDPSTLDELAACLNAAAVYQERLGHHQDAARIVDEAISISRNVTTEESDENLATSLHNRATFLAEMGRYEEAAACMKEACDIRKNLGHDDLGISRSLLACYIKEVKEGSGFVVSEAGPRSVSRVIDDRAAL